MLKKLNDLHFKIIVYIFCALIGLLITASLLSLITHTTINALIDSILTEEIQFAIRMSVVTSLSSTALCVLVAVPAAYALTRYRFRGSNLVNTILELPLALPPVVSGLALLILFGATGFGRALADAGIRFVFTPQGIIMAQFFVIFPFMYRVMKSTFHSVNPRYEYVAKTLGCNEVETFRRVTLPMSRNGLLAGAIIAWCRGMGEFGAALMLAGATRLKTETLPSALYLNMTSGDLTLAIAAATILIVIAFVALFIFEKAGGAARSF